jgi:hypothetical protein
MGNPFRYFNSSPEVIRLAVMMYIRYPLSLRQVADILFERGIDICHETVRYWWNRFGPVFAAAIRKRVWRYKPSTTLLSLACTSFATSARPGLPPVCTENFIRID